MPIAFGYITRHHAFDALVELARAVYGSEPRSTVIAEDLWRAFPRGYVAGWIDGRMVGSIHLWPLDGRRAGDFLVGARRERELTEEDLATVCNSPRTVWYFAGLLVDPAWQGRGLGAHLFAEAMVRWYRDLPWRMPTHFTALGTSAEGLRFIDGFGMERVRPASETADGYPLFARVMQTDAELLDVVRSARSAADRKGRLVATG